MEDWAEIRRLRMSEEVPIRVIVRTLGVSRNAVREALASERPPRYERPPRRFDTPPTGADGARRGDVRGVGGDGDPTKRGVVSTASYEAREYGVHSGVPLRTAARRCPEAVFLAVDRELYEAASAKVMATLHEVDAVVEVLGWDEAFLAVETDDPEASAREIQQRVRAATDLDCSVGIGQNKLQAKLATGFGKPAGIFRLTHESWFPLLGERPTDVLWGIGSKTAKRLSGMGISTVLELSRADPQALAAAVGVVGRVAPRAARQPAAATTSSPGCVPNSKKATVTAECMLVRSAERKRGRSTHTATGVTRPTRLSRDQEMLM